MDRVNNKCHIPKGTHGNALEALELHVLTKKTPPKTKTNSQLHQDFSLYGTSAQHMLATLLTNFFPLFTLHESHKYQMLISSGVWTVLYKLHFTTV